MSIFNKLKDNLAEYIEVRIRTVQLAIVEKTSFVLSHIIYILILLLIGFAILLFLGFSMVEFYTLLTGSHMFGTLLTVATYLLFFVIVYLSRKFVINRFSDMFVRMLTQQEENKDDETINKD